MKITVGQNIEKEINSECCSKEKTNISYSKHIFEFEWYLSNIQVVCLNQSVKSKKMETQPNNLVSGHEDLETELTEMLEIVILPERSEANEQCIYIVPPKLRETNPKAYTPQIISIGPFHHPRGSGEQDNILEPMEELKLKYLKRFLSRTHVSIGQFVPKLKEWESRIRCCYARLIKYNSNDFLKMILADACFIIEYFLRDYTDEDMDENDPLYLKLSMRSDIEEDLMLLENQLPFFLLEDIYNLAGMNNKYPSFLKITFNFFQEHNMQNINPEGICPKHLTDLLRTFMLPPSFDEEISVMNVIDHLYTASQLSEAGLVFKVSHERKCLLDIEFNEGVLTMPSFHVHDGTEKYMRNVLAFDDCHSRITQYIAQYLMILDFLINTEKDVNILVDKKIIVNWMCDANSVAKMVNSLGRNISMPCLTSKYYSLCNNLNGFYENPRNKYKAIFIHEYFNTPWKIASTSAAVLLLLLTLIQAICSVISIA